MKLIVGLGNPGKQYQLTRHNIGFIILDLLSEYLNSNLQEHKFDGQFTKIKYHDEDLILLKPLTFMNLSGNCVVNFIHYFKIRTEDVLIIHDEIDLDFGRIQFKANSSSAGHNGIKDIFLKTKEKTFTRLRIGVGRNSNFNTADWVLSKFNTEELKRITERKDLFIEAILAWIADHDIKKLMNNFNSQEF